MRGFLYLAALIIFSAVPVLIALLWFYRRRPEFLPFPFLLSLAAGVLSLVPAALLQYLVPTVESVGIGSFSYHVFVRIALTEEAGRFVVLLPLIRQLRARSRTAGPRSGGSGPGGVSEGLVAGLAFATVETVSYALADPGIALTRVLTAAPLHGACGARVGMAAAGIASAPGRSLFRFLSAVAIHGVYNAMLVVPSFPAFLPVVLAFLALGSSIAAIRAERAK